MLPPSLVTSCLRCIRPSIFSVRTKFTLSHHWLIWQTFVKFVLNRIPPARANAKSVHKSLDILLIRRMIVAIGHQSWKYCIAMNKSCCCVTFSACFFHRLLHCFCIVFAHRFFSVRTKFCLSNHCLILQTFVKFVLNRIPPVRAHFQCSFFYALIRIIVTVFCYLRYT